MHCWKIESIIVSVGSDLVEFKAYLFKFALQTLVQLL